MEIKRFSINFSSIPKQFTSRLDPKYREFWDIKKGKTVNINNTIKLAKVLEEVRVTKLKKGELNKEYNLINISDQEPKYVAIDNIEIVEEINSDKTPLWEAEIIISKLGLPKGYIYENDGTYECLIGSTELIPYKIINLDYNKKFLKYLLMLDEVLVNFTGLESGKTPSHKRVNPYDLLKIEIPYVSKQKQKEAEKKISVLELEIINLKSQIREDLELINEIFSNEHGYDKDLWRKYGKGMTAGTQKSNDKEKSIFPISFSSFSNSKILRCSTRFHNPLTQKLNKLVESLPTLKAENVISEISKGVQPKYDDEGSIPVIKIANLKNREVDFTEAEMVTEEFFNEVKDKAGVEKGDIVISATGKVSLGKIDYYDIEDQETIIAVDNYRIKLKRNIIPLFFVYYFRSILGAFQIERDYTGTTNQIHLYDHQIKQFDILDISLWEQKKIVQRIKKALDSQSEIRNQIKIKREEINKIIRESC